MTVVETNNTFGRKTKTDPMICESNCFSCGDSLTQKESFWPARCVVGSVSASSLHPEFPGRHAMVDARRHSQLTGCQREQDFHFLARVHSLGH